MSLKETVLSVLQKVESEDGFISGQDLAERCGVTRTSVWKAVEALRKDGADITAVTNKGYKLCSSDIFNQKSIIECLKDKTVKVHFFTSIDSTNSEAKRVLADAPVNDVHKNVYVAESQTCGRGRLGRSFYSPQQSGIYFSLVYSNGPVLKPAVITASAGVAVCRAIQKLYGFDAKIKWVNDIYINGKKVCGILTEGIANFETGRIDAAVIGIGINITTNSAQPDELKDIAGSIISSGGNKKRAELCAFVIDELYEILDGNDEMIQKAMQEYRKRSNLIGKEVEISPVINTSDKNYKCLVLDVTEDAKLLVKTMDGEIKCLDSGEVSLHSKVML